MFNKNKFKLGVFSANCSGGLSITKVKENWINSWDNNLKIAQLADEAGLEFLLPVARWLGYKKESDFHSDILEPIVWASALLAATKNISVFSTIHTSFHHPVIIAKQLATMDHIGNGRVGLNIVCGWDKIEYVAFGKQFFQEHKMRYHYGQEWFDIIKNLWRDKKAFSWNSPFFKLKDVYSLPLPLQEKIPILNAAGSNEGKQFAICNVDYLFTPTINIDHLKKNIIELKKQSKLQNRRNPLGLLTHCYVVYRPTREEAKEYHHYSLQKNADWVTVDKVINLMFENAKSFPKNQLCSLRNRFSAGYGGYPLIGTPDNIADKIKELCYAGLSGTTLSFVNYIDEFPYFRDEVLPRLEKLGLRDSLKQNS